MPDFDRITVEGAVVQAVLVTRQKLEMSLVESLKTTVTAQRQI